MNAIITSIQALPEEKRRALAKLALILAGIILLVIFGFSITKRLNSEITDHPITSSPEKFTAIPENNALSPAISFFDSFKSVKKFIIQEDHPMEREWNGLRHFGTVLKDAIVSFGTMLKEMFFSFGNLIASGIRYLKEGKTIQGTSNE